MKWVKPTRRGYAQSSSSVPTASDCDTNPMVPGSAPTREKLALRPMWGASIPSVPPPRIRTPCSRAARSVCSCTVRPSAPVSSPSARATTTTARVPRAPSSSTRSGIVRGGVHRIARSGVRGRLATSGYVRTPATASYRGFTGMIGPSNPPARRLCMMTWPTR